MRETYLDVARGLGIILVVFGHVQRGMSDASLIYAGYPFKIIDFSLYTFHMPLFFFLSGLHVWSSLNKGKIRFLKSKVVTIVIPYFIWSIIQGSVQIAMSGSVNHPMTWADWPKLFYSPIGQFWFLYALMVWQLIALICEKVKFIFILISVISFGVSGLLGDTFLAELLRMGIFFAFGTLVGPQIGGLVKICAKSWSLVLLMAIFVGDIYLIYGHSGYGSWEALPAAVAGMFIVLAICYLLSAIQWDRLLRFLGAESLAIYVMHIMAASGARIILLKFGVHNMWLHFLIGVLLGVALPILANIIIQKIKREIISVLPRHRSV